MKLKEFIWEESQKQKQKQKMEKIVKALRKNLFFRIQSNLDLPKNGEPLDTEHRERRELLQQTLGQLQRNSAAEVIKKELGDFAPEIETLIKEVVVDVIAESIKQLVSD